MHQISAPLKVPREPMADIGNSLAEGRDFEKRYLRFSSAGPFVSEHLSNTY